MTLIRVCQNERDVLFLRDVARKKSFAIFRHDPYLVKVVAEYWIDVDAYCERSDFPLRNQFGSANSNDDMESGCGIHVVGENWWLDEPQIGRSFYGLMIYDEMATISDMLKNFVRNCLLWVITPTFRSHIVTKFLAC